MASEHFKTWMKTTTKDRKKEVAKSAKTSPALLYHLATGYRKASSQLAARIEKASDGALTRADMNETCASCQYYKECKK